MLAFDKKLEGLVARRFVQGIFRFLKQQAKTELGLRPVKLAHPGAITAVQRFNSAAQLSVHHHTLATDGVFVVEEPNGAPEFIQLRGPSEAEVAQVSWEVCQTVIADLKKLGRWTDSADEQAAEFAEREPGLAACYAGSIAGTLTLGPSAGQRVVRLRAQPKKRSPGHRPGHGFDVHAGVRVHPNDRAGLERLCRYLLRPPLARDRLRRRANGDVEVRLKRRWSDGTTHMVYEPLDFLAKLAALVPPPRKNLVRYAGVFAPNAKLRSQIVPKTEPSEAEPCEAHDDGNSSGTRAATASEGHGGRPRLGWAQLMARVFSLDVLECPKCEAKGMQRIATITDGASLRKLLRSVGLPADSPIPSPARLPPQAELDFVA